MTWWIASGLAVVFGAFVLWWLIQPIHYRDVTRGDLADCLSRLLLHSKPGSWMTVKGDHGAVTLELTTGNVNTGVVETQVQFFSSDHLDASSVARFLSDRGFACNVVTGSKLELSFQQPEAVSGSIEAVALILDCLGSKPSATLDVRMNTRTDPESLRVALDAFQNQSNHRLLKTVGRRGEQMLDRRRDRKEGRS